MKEQQLIPKKAPQITGPKAMKQQAPPQQPQELPADASQTPAQTGTKKQGGPAAAQPQEKLDKVAFEDPTRPKGQKQPANPKSQNPA
jgi:hypothetical protein